MSDFEARNFFKRGNTLVPADIHADELMGEIAEKKEVLVSIRQPRSPQHHRWVFVMLQKVFDNIDFPGTFEDFLDALKIEIGHADKRAMFNGQVVPVPRSIDWASVDQIKFKRLVNRMLYAIQMHFGINGEALMKEVASEAGPMRDTVDPETGEITEVDDATKPETKAETSTDLPDFLRRGHPDCIVSESGGPAPATAPEEAGAPSEEDAHVESESETANGKTRAKDGAGQVPVLSDGHRRALQKFHATLSGFEQDSLVDKERDKFVSELRIHEGDPLSEAMKAVLSAHRYRIAGKANAADCERILDEIINPKVEELA